MSGEPCVSQINPQDFAEGVFPGRLPRDDFRVCIAQGAHAAVQAHAKTSLHAEVCGVMLGKVQRDAAGVFLLIEDVIEGQQAQGAEAKVTFTPDAWDYIFKEQEGRDPELKMVGWYHTHPRFGIFLSRYDQFIHQNFFAVEPWMVAYVVDPVRDEEGFFFWNTGGSRRLERYWIGEQPRRSDGAEFDGRDLADDRVPAPEPSRPAAPPPGVRAAAPRTEDPEPDNLLTWGLMGVVVLFTLMLLGWSMLSSRSAERQLADDIGETRLLQQKLLLYQADLARELAEMRELQGLPKSKQTSLVMLEQTLRNQLQHQLEASVAATDSQSTASQPPASQPPASQPPASQAPASPQIQGPPRAPEDAQ